jgi:translocation and assembly module TamA
MRRPFLVSMPAFWPAFLLVSTLLLQGCSLLPSHKTEADAAAMAAVGDTKVLQSGADDDKAAPTRDAFSLDVQAPDTLAQYLGRHLELQRFRQLDDLTSTELSRLLGAADANARELLGTMGYFSPTLHMQMRDTPDDPQALRAVTIRVEPGPRTVIRDVSIDFTGEIRQDVAAQPQRAGIESVWGLRPGQYFTQNAWDNAKTGGLRALTAFRFPTATIGSSLADVDADAADARLKVTYDSGPAFRFGPVQVQNQNQGRSRYGDDAVRLLARVPTGADYDAARLLASQQRLARSGYFDSVFLAVDTEAADPQNAPVIAQIREAPFQRMIFGVGVSTDSGPRISVDHTHNQMPPTDWRAVSKFAYDNKTVTLNSEWMSLPNESGWRRVVGGDLLEEPTGNYDVRSGRVRMGRIQEGDDRIDRSHMLQLDYANNQGVDAPPSASSVSFNWGWTGRYFDSNILPSSGMGLAVEVGPGVTLSGERLPFLRTYARWLGFLPLDLVQDDNGVTRRSRLALRAEGGAVLSRDTARIPATLMFVTGGDTTVRGYSYRSIGTRTENGKIFAGRYLMSGGVEWQRPFIYDGEMTNIESTVFIDAGMVADALHDNSTKVGVGVGGRWRSPIGPIQLDLAYALATKRLRLHLRLGFTF